MNSRPKFFPISVDQTLLLQAAVPSMIDQIAVVRVVLGKKMNSFFIQWLHGVE